MLDTIRQYISEPEALALLAEEATELSHAALKLRRVMDGSNPTYTGKLSQAYHNVIEEIADVWLLLQVLKLADDEDAINAVMDQKAKRWISRIMACRPGVRFDEHTASGLLDD